MQSEPVKLIGRQTVRKQQLSSQLQDEQQQLADPFAQIILQLLQNGAMLKTEPEAQGQAGGEVANTNVVTSVPMQTITNLPQIPMQEQQIAAQLTEPLTELQPEQIMAQQQMQSEVQEQQGMSAFTTEAKSGISEQAEGMQESTPVSPKAQQQALQQMDRMDLKQGAEGKEPSSKLGQQLKLEQAMRQTTEQVRNRSTTKDQRSQQTKELDVDALQVQAETHRAVLNERISLAHTGQSEKRLSGGFEKQIAEELYAGLANGKSEFIIRLKPQTLGEVTVKLTEKDGQMTLRLSAVNEKTVKLLNNQLDALREAVRPMQVEVKQVVGQSQSADGQNLSQQMDMSGGHFFQQSNQAGQSFYRSAQQGCVIADEPEEAMASQQQAMAAAAQIGQNMLDLYV